MAIGTTVKVGWDASAVKSGMTALRGAFGGVFRGFRQVGIGAARQVGARMTDMLGRVLMAVPSGIKETMDWAGNLNDMSAQTGVAIDKLVIMEEALRLAGASASDTSRMISTLADNLHEAAQGEGPAREALNRLGIFASDIEALPVDKAFEKIGRRVAELGPEFKGLEGTMADLFGARMGFKLIRFFRDFDGGMQTARKNVGDFAGRINKSAEAYDNMADALDRFEMRWRELMSVVIDEATNLFGSEWIDKAFDWASPEKVRAGIAALKQGFTDFVGWIKSGGIKTIFHDIGKMIGDGIMESLKQMNPFGTMWGTIKRGIGGGGMVGPAGGDLSQLINQGYEQTAYLRKIADKKGGWA